MIVCEEIEELLQRTTVITDVGTCDYLDYSIIDNPNEPYSFYVTKKECNLTTFHCHDKCNNFMFDTNNGITSIIKTVVPKVHNYYGGMTCLFSNDKKDYDKSHTELINSIKNKKNSVIIIKTQNNHDSILKTFSNFGDVIILNNSGKIIKCTKEYELMDCLLIRVGLCPEIMSEKCIDYFLNLIDVYLDDKIYTIENITKIFVSNLKTNTKEQKYFAKYDWKSIIFTAMEKYEKYGLVDYLPIQSLLTYVKYEDFPDVYTTLFVNRPTEGIKYLPESYYPELFPRLTSRDISLLTHDNYMYNPKEKNAFELCKSLIVNSKYTFCSDTIKFFKLFKENEVNILLELIINNVIADRRKNKVTDKDILETIKSINDDVLTNIVLNKKILSKIFLIKFDVDCIFTEKLILNMLDAYGKSLVCDELIEFVELYPSSPISEKILELKLVIIRANKYTCIVCMDPTHDLRIFDNCRHGNICKICEKQINCCPICNKSFVSCVKIFIC